MGRPTENPKTKRLEIRISDDEKQKLEYCVKVMGRTKTDILILGLDKVYNELKEK